MDWNGIDKYRNVYKNILECVNLYKIISKYDTFFVFGVKFDILGFG